MSEPTDSKRIPLRPTLVLGLGGTGGKVALELKARLEEQFGGNRRYNDFIKFLYFDTATENFRTYQPSHTELPAVTLLPGNEFVRVSDVPLHDLMESKADGSALAAILPEILHSTQIDQGAQQVRRLGRVAFFYHYRRIKDKLEQTLRELRNPDVRNINEIGANFRLDDRLRIFLVASICGGTGGGMFIDMAYLARRLASSGTSSARQVDLVGMLMLPEAFPEVRTTGEGRIRANAYASLLDLEYYNRDTLDAEATYHEIFPTETVTVNSPPFSFCYLISGSSTKWELNGNNEIAPVLAEILQTMIVTRVGEQLDATLDNVRTYSLNQRHSGFRTTYSAIGVGEIIYPRVWLQKGIAQALQSELIEKYIIGQDDINLNLGGVKTWYEDLRLQIEADLKRQLPLESVITANLDMLRHETSMQSDLITELQNAYSYALQQFDQRIVAQVRNNQDFALRKASESLAIEVRKQVDNGLLGGIERHGLRWMYMLLEALQKEILAELDSRRKIDSRGSRDSILNQHINLIAQAENIPLFVGKWWARRRTEQACLELRNFITKNLMDNLITRSIYNVLTDLLPEIDRQRQAINLSLAFWERERSVIDSTLHRPRFTVLTQSVLSVDEAQVLIRGAVNSITQGDKINILLTELSDHIGQLSSSLDVGKQAICARQLKDFCAGRYVVDSSIIDEIQDKVDLVRTLGEQAQPLLVYREGILQKLPPSQINVVGARAREDADWIRSHINQQGDVTAVDTDDKTTVTYLTTHHGIPANALNRFHEYRSHYHRLRTESRSAIFHLNNKYETEPYNPESAYFMHAENLEFNFARALAYGWIARLSDTKLFGQKDGKAIPELWVFETEFQKKFVEIAGHEIAQLTDNLEQFRTQNVPSVAAQEGIRASSLALNELELFQANLKLHVEPPAHLEDKLIDRGYALAVLRYESDIMKWRYASSLEQVLDALRAGHSHILAAMFQRAFNAHYQNEPEKWDTRVEVFIRVRQDDKGKFRPIWSGQAKAEVEERVYNWLRVYQRGLGSQGG